MAVAPVNGAAAVTVVYQCLGQREELVRLDPQTGARRWAWRLPAGRAIVTPAVAAISADTIGVLVSGRGAEAPVRPGWPTPDAGALSLIAVGAATGRPRWQVGQVPASAGVYGGAGRLCVVAGFGAGCYTADHGTRAWRWRPSDSVHGGPPDPGAVADHGQLLMVAPNPTTSSSRPASAASRPVAGAFRLQVMNLADGRIVAVRPLPSVDLGPAQAPVSTANPPVVLGVTADTVLIGEGDVVEAFGR